MSDMSGDERAVMRGTSPTRAAAPRRQAAAPRASPDPPFGIIVLVAESEQEARAIMRGDPSLAVAVQTPELHPFRTSLLAGRH
jgi:hypothetical protein